MTQRFCLLLLFAGLWLGGSVQAQAPADPPAKMLSMLASRAPEAPTHTSVPFRLKNVVNELWDGTVWSNGFRMSFSFDEKGRQTEWLTEEWDGTDWVPSFRRQTSYLFASQDLGVPTLEVDQVWDGFSWINQGRTSYGYDVQNRLISSANDFFDPATNAWVGTFRNHYAYDAAGRLFQIEEQEWDAAGWVNTVQTTFFFAGDALEAVTYAGWDGTAWSATGRDVVTVAGNDVEVTSQRWTGLTYVNESRMTFFGLSVEELQEQIDGFQNPGMDLTLIYGLLGLEYLVEEWNPAGQRWENLEQVLVTFDGEGRPQTQVSQSWEDGEWVNVQQQELSFNAEGNLGLAVVSLWDGTDWVFAFRQFFTWEPSEPSTGTDDGELPGGFVLAQNYPNPFNPQTRIAYTLPAAGPVRLAVYDAQGRLVATLVDGVQAAGAQEVTFDAAGLPSGIYLYRLEAGTYRAVRAMHLAK